MGPRAIAEGPARWRAAIRLRPPGRVPAAGRDHGRARRGARPRVDRLDPDRGALRRARRAHARRRWSSSTAPPRSASRGGPEAGLELLEPLLADGRARRLPAAARDARRAAPAAGRHRRRRAAPTSGRSSSPPTRWSAPSSNGVWRTCPDRGRCCVVSMRPQIRGPRRQTGGELRTEATRMSPTWSRSGFDRRRRDRAQHRLDRAGRVHRAITRTGSRETWVLSRREDGWHVAAYQSTSEHAA